MIIDNIIDIISRAVATGIILFLYSLSQYNTSVFYSYIGLLSCDENVIDIGLNPPLLRVSGSKIRRRYNHRHTNISYAVYYCSLYNI